MDLFELARDAGRLLAVAGSAISAEVHVADDGATRRVVLVASADEARLLDMPEIAARCRHLRRDQPMWIWAPLVSVVRAFPVLGPGGALAQVVEDLLLRLRARSDEQAVLVAHRGHVVLLVAAPEQSVEIVGIGRT